jgi:acyl carrier protein
MSKDFNKEIEIVIEAVFARNDYDDATLLASWTWDSLARVLLTAEVQERFGIDLTVEEMNRWTRVVDLTGYLIDQIEVEKT